MNRSVHGCILLLAILSSSLADQKPATTKLLIALGSYRERPRHPNIFFYEHDGVGKGEIVGLGGLDGQGQGELLMALFGILRGAHGQVWVKGKRRRITSPAAAASAAAGAGGGAAGAARAAAAPACGLASRSGCAAGPA